MAADNGWMNERLYELAPACRTASASALIVDWATSLPWG